MCSLQKLVVPFFGAVLFRLAIIAPHFVFSRTPIFSYCGCVMGDLLPVFQSLCPRRGADIESLDFETYEACRTFSVIIIRKTGQHTGLGQYSLGVFPLFVVALFAWLMISAVLLRTGGFTFRGSSALPTRLPLSLSRRPLMFWNYKT